jgi:hypothetical protein
MRTNLFLSLILALLVSAAPGFAQADLQAEVPFDFHAGKTIFPAGVYSLDIQNSGLVMIQDRRGRNSAFVGTLGIGGGPQSQDSKLVFHRRGDQYFLSELWVEGRAAGRQVIRPRTEDAEAKMASHKKVTILARAR